MSWSIVAGEFLVGVGAALALGTGAALVRYRRTGSFPGQEEGQSASVTSAWVKFGLGLGLLVWGLATLDAAGLF